MRLEALKVGFEISCVGSGRSELAHAIEAAWDRCLVDGDQPPVQRLRVLLEDDPETLAAEAGAADLFGSDLPTVMDRLSPLITRLAVSERARDLTMFHACAVADPATGDAAVLYGPSGTGKTTLARALGTDFVYLTDETAAVTSDFLLVPYPKPLSILLAPDDPLKEQVSPGRIGLLGPAPGPFRLRALVQLRRDPAHVGDAVLERLLTIDALPELVGQTSYTRAMDRPLHRLAGLAREAGGVRRVTYAEAVPAPPARGCAPRRGRLMRARRLEVVDEYVEDDRVALFTMGGMVVVLSELASVAWSALGESWTSAEQISDELVQVFGSPEGGDALGATETALRTLADNELVEVDEG